MRQLPPTITAGWRPSEVEVIFCEENSLTARTILQAMAEAAAADGYTVRATDRYTGCAPVLMLWGVGRPEHMAARATHLEAGGRAILWDMGYFGRGKHDAYVRVTLDHDHPWRDLDDTPPDPSRWGSFGIELREDFDPDGHIVLACLGRKSIESRGLHGWNDRAHKRLMALYPGVRVVRREKPSSRHATVPLISEVLRGARLLYCLHSNCAIDAAIAGVPFECEDGAAWWLKQRPYTPENRLDFLRRLCWWQWRCYEATEAWQFIRGRL